jgi:hypothetical protein
VNGKTGAELVQALSADPERSGRQSAVGQREPRPKAELGAAECIFIFTLWGVCVDPVVRAVSRAGKAHQEGVAETSVSRRDGCVGDALAPTREETSSLITTAKNYWKHDEAQRRLVLKRKWTNLINASDRSAMPT